MRMNTGKTLFAQLMDFVPWSSFTRLVARYDGDRRVRALSCAEQYRALAFAQLTYRESLRGNIPRFIYISDGKLHDVNALYLLLPEPGAIYVMDRGSDRNTGSGSQTPPARTPLDPAVVRRTARSGIRWRPRQRASLCEGVAG